MTPGDTPPEPIFAAAYVRMSTEHQQYSTSNQMRCTASTITRDGFAADGSPVERGTAML